MATSYAPPSFFDSKIPQSEPLNREELFASESYLKAQELALSKGVTLDDVSELTPRFWSLWVDPELTLDGAASTLFSIQYNLVVGTLGALASDRDDLQDLIRDLLEFKTIGQFCLTEVEHGLDAFNLETTATFVNDGYILHTPHDGAAKFMPPTIPVLGRPCVAIIWAQLIVDNTKHGIRPFLVQLNNGYRMNKGIKSRFLPYRGPSAPVNHSITSFDHLKLPLTSLLGEHDTPFTPHQLFLLSIWRVAVGTLSLSILAVPGLKMSSYIAYHYSARRMVGALPNRRPILSFRTQQLPIYTAAAQAGVLDAFARHATEFFSDPNMDLRVRHAMATCVKAVMVSTYQSTSLTLSDRCGAQGLFNFNQMCKHHSEMRGISIAEGDTLALSIRLASELLIGRYSLPESPNPTSLLARHEAGLLTEFQELCKANGGNRSQFFSDQILPQCLPIVEAIGNRIAYDAAVAAGLPSEMIHLFECSVVKSDLAWYSENSILTRSQFRQMEDEAVRNAEPHVEGWIQGFDIEHCITSPIVSENSWRSFVNSLPTFTHNGKRMPMARL